MSRVLDKLRAMRQLEPRATVTETQRVCALPREPTQPAPLALELETCQLHLRPLQQQALTALRGGGLLGLIGVGHGKSWIACLAGAASDAQLAIIFAPASTLATLRRTAAQLRAHFRLPPQLEIFSYTRLSRPDGAELLPRLCADLPDDQIVIVLDEAHRLKRQGSARTKRVARFLAERPGVRIAALSGTMASKSIKDYAHLAEWALGDASPVPRPFACRHTLNSWAECLDAEGRPAPSHWRYLAPVMEAFAPELLPTRRYADTRKAARIAYQRRLRSAAGVVASTEGSIGSSLLLHRLDVDLPSCVSEALADCEQGLTPTGEFIPDDVTGWRLSRSIAQGFYYEWVWPAGVPDEDWLEARSNWNRHVRAQLDRANIDGYDSPLLIFNETQRQVEAGQRGAIHRAWAAWDEQRHKPAPPVRAVWLDDFFITDALDQLRKIGRPAIVWYDSRAVGQALAARGLPTYGAGQEPPTVAQNCAMSIQAHGIGKNLQPWSANLVLAAPSGGQVWEQLLGRTHRQGQTADEIDVWIYQHAPVFERALTKAREQARFLEDSQGNRQKLLYATKTWG